MIGHLRLHLKSQSNMVTESNFIILRLGYQYISRTFLSQSMFLGIQSAVGNPKPSLYSSQNLSLLKLISSKTSPKDDDFTVSYLTNNCMLSPEAASLASRKVKLLTPENPESVLLTLRNHEFSQTQISNIVRRRPNILLMNAQKTLLPKLEFLYSMGVPRKDIARVLTVNPSIFLGRSLENHIIPTFEFLKSVLLDNDKVLAVFKGRPWFFSGNFSKNIIPNIKVLRDLGLPESNVVLLLAHFSGTLMKKHQRFVELVEEVKEMGFDPNKATFVMAIHVLSVDGNASRRDKCHEIYRRLGWSGDDILFAFKKQPLCMLLSENKITSAVDLLVTKMGWSSSMIVKSPGVLFFSLKKRLIPRCSVIKVLSLKGLMTKTYSLSMIFVPTENLFLKRFVYKYLNEVPELLSVYEGKVKIQMG